MFVDYREQGASDAQAQTDGGVSLQPAIEQWKVEVEEPFRTSLAMIQICPRDIARGPPSGNIEGLYKSDEAKVRELMPYV